jgi:hypothetical protein
MLVNYLSPVKITVSDDQDGGMSFFQEENNYGGPGRGVGRNFQCGDRGRGRIYKNEQGDSKYNRNSHDYPYHVWYNPGCNAHELCKEQKQRDLQYLMFLKEMRCRQIKERGCADDRKRRLLKTKEDTTSPTVCIEALYIGCMIDAVENRDIATLDIPGAFIQASIDEEVHV